MSNTTKFERSGDCNTVSNSLIIDSTEDESDELFSDDEQKKEIKYKSDASLDASVSNRSETPVLSFNSNSTIVSSEAVVPSTPLSLLPFLNKINEQWSSDLETPQTHPYIKPSPSSKTTEETSKSEQQTPDVSTKSINKIVSVSPVIISKAVRRRPKRRIFNSSISIDPLTVPNNEDITVNIKEETSFSFKDFNFIAQDDTKNVSVSIPCIDNIPENCKFEVLHNIQDTYNNKETEKFNNDIPDNLNTSTQEFFNNASFSNIDELCSDNVNIQATAKISRQCTQKQTIDNTDKEKNVEENKNIGFSTARGASINVSQQALLKAKRLFADAFDADEIQNYELCTKNTSIEQKNKLLPSSSFVKNVSINTTEKVSSKQKLQFTETLKNYEKMYTTDCSKPIINKSSLKEINTDSVLFSTASGAPINISKAALSKANALLADESDKNNFDDDDALIKYETSSMDRNFRKPNNIAVPSFTANRSINISEKSLTKTKIFAEQIDAVEPDISNKVDTSDNNQCETSNIGFYTARGIPINVSKQALSKATAQFAEQLDDPLEYAIIAKKINDNEVKKEKVNVSKIGFQTARGKSISISEQALSKARVLFAEQLDDILEPISAKEVNVHNKEVKKIEEKVSNIGFRTACGAPINVSEQALFKAKAQFAEELDDQLEYAIIAKKTNDNEVKKEEVNVSKIGFQTARGKSISISEQALSKARVLFAEQLGDTLKPMESISVEEVNSHNKEVKKLEEKISNIGFRTACGTPINISEQTLSKANAQFVEQLDDSLEPLIANKTDDNEVNISKIGFQTARGKSINISKQALSKAKAQFAEQLDDSLEPVIANKTNDDEVNISKIGFQTARGKSINISKQALSKAKAQFAEQLDDSLEPVIANKTNDNEVNVSKIGFQTAHGKSIIISKQALSKANALFANQFDYPLEINVPENINPDDEEVKKHDLKMYSESQIASNQQTVSNSTILKERALFSNDCIDDNSLDLTHTLLQKRKLNDTNSDENTPLGRNRLSELKKARLSDEFQGRKLFFDDPSFDMDNNENRNTDKIKQASSITDFVFESPKRDTIETTESDIAGSPVIGRPSISRKRKSLRHQREKNSTLWADKMILGDENVTQQKNVVPENTCKMSDEKESNVEMQKSTQTKIQKAHNSNTESSEYGDTQMMMDFINESTKILQDRLAAALEQEKTITAKRRYGSKQLVGHLYQYKQINSNARLSLREIGNGAPPVMRSYQELIDGQISPNILTITAVTAASYKFRCSDFYGSDVARYNVSGIEMEDDVRLIMDENGYVGIWEFLRGFLVSPGVDPNLVPARWVENHYRWIVWKLASMDRMKFGPAELPRALTPSRVMAQLKYRYDREIDQSQRPAIRHILEKDDVASKRMILCVSCIVENNNVSMEIGKSPRIGVSKWRIELTDGWYSVPACIDIGMVKSISTGRIKEGTKLVVFGAELLNCDQGFYPLEAPADVCLKLHTNSTRRARWDAKLGYASRSGAIPIKLRNVCSSGGLIGKMTIIVARVYPMLYHERLASGDSIIRNAKCEEKAQSKYEQQCWSNIEGFYAKAEKDFQKDGLSSESDNMAIQLNEKYENLSSEDFVPKKQRDELLQELRQQEEMFKQKLQSKLRENLPVPRQVSPLLKVRICDENASAILSIWSPSEEVIDAVKEGACVSLCNVIASGKRGSELQLTAGRCAIFKPGKMHDTSYPARVCTSFCEITNSEFAPPYGEFDVVGFVCSVGPAPYGMKDFEVAHLAYPREDSNDSSYLSILFWQGISSYGYAKILTVGSIVACSNLEWRRATSWNVPVAYCTERSTFTHNPRANHLYESFESLRNLITDPVKYAEKSSSELNVKLQNKITSTRYTPNKNTPNKMNDSTSSVDKKLIDYTSPLSTPKLGVGGSSSFTEGVSNPSIQRRLEKLQYYSEPPELSPIILKKSKRISLDFRSPIYIPGANSAKDTSNSNKPRDSNLSDASKKQ